MVWTREKNRFGWEALRGDYQPTDERKAWFSAALADDLAGVAPAYISTGALDLFLDEDLDYARRLIDCGVPTELHVYPGAIHAFEMVPDTGACRAGGDGLAARAGATAGVSSLAETPPSGPDAGLLPARNGCGRTSAGARRPWWSRWRSKLLLLLALLSLSRSVEPPPRRS